MSRNQVSMVGRPLLMLAALAVVVVVIGYLALSQGAVGRFSGETPRERALQQIREQLGPAAELRYTETGTGRAVCGYAGRSRGAGPVAFVSRPNRILFSDDPLPREFRETQARFCPGFLQAPAR